MAPATDELRPLLGCFGALRRYDVTAIRSIVLWAPIDMPSILRVMVTTVALVASHGACVSSTPPRASSGDDASRSFILRPEELGRQGATDDLLERLAKHPYAYFRALAEPFARRVCAHFNDQRWMLPMVTVHGDAHVEQFVLTRNAYGLEDFDQVGFGPAVLDLVRFSSSIHLVCYGPRFDCRPEAAITRFLDGYAAGIQDPNRAVPSPSIVDRLRRTPHSNPREFLSWAESKMLPVDDGVEANVRRAWAIFVRYMAEVTPDLDPMALQIIRVGRLKMGIGSALVDKFLFRVRGPTDGAHDDLILEAKRQSLPGHVPCLSLPPVGGMLRPVVATAQLGRRRPAILGYAPLDETEDRPEHFWVQSWTPGYAEVSIDDLQSQRELDELAYDAGHQLGAANTGRAPRWLKPQLQWVQLRALERTRNDVTQVSKAFAEAIIEQWRAFRLAHSDAQSASHNP